MTEVLPLTPDQLAAFVELRERHPDVRAVLVGAAALACHLPLTRFTHGIDIAIAPISLLSRSPSLSVKPRSEGERPQGATSIGDGSPFGPGPESR